MNGDIYFKFMSIRQATGKLVFAQPIPKKASVVINPDEVLITTSGQADVAVAASLLLVGLSAKKVAATDSDYADNTDLAMYKVLPDEYYEATVVTGTLTTAMVGNSYDLADETGIDVTGTTYNQVQIVGFISSSLALIKFHKAVVA